MEELYSINRMVQFYLPAQDVVEELSSNKRMVQFHLLCQNVVVVLWAGNNSMASPLGQLKICGGRRPPRIICGLYCNLTMKTKLIAGTIGQQKIVCLKIQPQITGYMIPYTATKDPIGV